MTYSDQTIEKLAELSMLYLSDEEKKELRADLENILNMFNDLKNVNTDGLEQLRSPLEHQQFMRNDKVIESPDPKTYQTLSAETEQQLYLVPKVIE